MIAAVTGKRRRGFWRGEGEAAKLGGDRGSVVDWAPAGLSKKRETEREETERRERRAIGAAVAHRWTAVVGRRQLRRQAAAVARVR